MISRIRYLGAAVALAALGAAPVTAGADEPGASGSQPPAPDDGASGEVPGQVRVTEAEAERALERALVQAGGLLLPAGNVELEPSLRYARREDAIPAFFTREGETFLGQTRRNADELTGDLALRIGLPGDSQIELGLPYHWRRVERVQEIGGSPDGTSRRRGAGTGNLRVGLAKTLLREVPGRPDLVARLRWDTRSGTARDDGVAIASDFEAARLSFTAIKRQDPLVFLGTLAYAHVFEHDGVQPGAAITPSLGAFLALSPTTSMRFLFSQRFAEEAEVDGEPVAGSAATAATLTLGGSSLLAPGVLLNLSVDMGLTGDADDVGLRLALPIRF